jgi:hypothetical protein
MKKRSALASLLWLACSNEPQRLPADAGQPDGGSNTTPITERTPRTAYQCRVTRPRTDHTPRFWRAWPGLVTGASAPWFIRREAMTDLPISAPPGQLVVGSLAPDGSFGAATPVTGVVHDQVGPLAAVVSNGGFAAVWVEGEKLRFARFDAQGALAGAPKDLASGLDEQAVPRLVAGSDGGFAVVYTPEIASARQLHLLLLDATGAVKHGPRRLDQDGPALPAAAHAAALVAGPSGYGVLFRDVHDAKGGIDFMKIGPTGTDLVARKRIASVTAANSVAGGAAGFDPPTTALLETPSGYLAAWTETHITPGQFDSGGWSVVQLARLDQSGTMQEVAPLRAVADSINEVEPTLVPFGTAAAVMWARGHQIYICGGCVPDHRIDLMLVDPSDLTPVSNVATIDSPGLGKGGLLRRQVAVVGSSLLVTYQLTFHVHATAGSAAFACDP